MTNLNYFLIRRVHSLTGVIPLGVFLIGHLTTNSMAAFGQEAFSHKVELIHSLGPLLPFVEAAMIFIPLAIHILLGIFIAFTGKSNATDLGYGRNWAYTLQRWTGWAALAFIVYHTMELRFLDEPGARALTGSVLNGKVLTAGDVFFMHLAEEFQSVLYVLVYLLGGFAVIYHFANGLCTFCMTWGITVGARSQKTMSWIALATGLLLFGMLVAAIVGFRSAYDSAEYEAMRALLGGLPH